MYDLEPNSFLLAAELTHKAFESMLEVRAPLKCSPAIAFDAPHTRPHAHDATRPTHNTRSSLPTEHLTAPSRRRATARAQPLRRPQPPHAPECVPVVLAAHLFTRVRVQMHTVGGKGDVAKGMGKLGGVRDNVVAWDCPPAETWDATPEQWQAFRIKSARAAAQAEAKAALYETGISPPEVAFTCKQQVSKVRSVTIAAVADAALATAKEDAAWAARKRALKRGEALPGEATRGSGRAAGVLASPPTTKPTNGSPPRGARHPAWSMHRGGPGRMAAVAAKATESAADRLQTEGQGALTEEQARKLAELRAKAAGDAEVTGAISCASLAVSDEPLKAAVSMGGEADDAVSAASKPSAAEPSPGMLSYFFEASRPLELHSRPLASAAYFLEASRHPRIAHTHVAAYTCRRRYQHDMPDSHSPRRHRVGR